MGNNSGADVFSVTVKNADATTLDIYDVTTSTGTNDVTVGLLDQSSAQTAIGLVDTAIATVSSERANLGAVSNRMASTMANLDQIRVNLTASKGRIADADFAAGNSEFDQRPNLATGSDGDARPSQCEQATSPNVKYDRRYIAFNLKASLVKTRVFYFKNNHKQILSRSFTHCNVLCVNSN